MENEKMGFTSATEYKHSGCFLENGSGFFTIGFDNDEQENDFARRVCATWNACEGLETELLEGLPLNFKAHALQCADLREENTRLRAAVAEMENMPPGITINLQKSIMESLQDTMTCRQCSQMQVGFQ